MKKKNKVTLALSLIFLLLIGSIYAKNALEYFEEGLAAQNNEDWYSASTLFMEAINLNNVYFDAWYHLAQCSYQLGEFDLSLSQLETADKYAKDSDLCNNLKGMIYIAQGKLAEARDLFNSVLKKTPNNVDARFGLAELDLFNGKLGGATKQYNEALKREHDNRKALLSLALIASHEGKYDAALKYIDSSIKSYSGEKEVHYLASVIYSMVGDLDTANREALIALDIDANYDKARELLAKVLFLQGKYEEAITLCDYRLNKDRKLNSAWYLKGISYLELQNVEEAIDTFDTGLSIIPEDEVMRACLETLINDGENDFVAQGDERRKEWAAYHIKKARECEKRFDKQAATYEYQRALKIEPTNEEARRSYAGMLKLNGLNELYLEQLLFIRQNKLNIQTPIVEGGQKEAKLNYKDTLLNDTIEAYDSLLQDTLAKKWEVEPFYLDKTRWNVGLYYTKDSCINSKNVSQIHLLNDKVASLFSADTFLGLASSLVKATSDMIESFGEAYKKARDARQDYFAILSIDEGERDLTLIYTLYSARTGNKIKEGSFYGTGNDKYVNTIRRFRQDILEGLTVRGRIIGREGKTLLCDIGKSENLKAGSVFDIVKKDCISTSASEKGVSYKKQDILGAYTITKVGEEVSEGSFTYIGFYDKVNVGDEIVLVKEEGKTSAENVTALPAPLSNKTGEVSESVDVGLLEKDVSIKHIPSFIDLIRSIY